MTTSRGSGTVAGHGCTGCHNAPGLRNHHRITGASSCSCHGSSTEAAPGENTQPPYYGTSATKANNACNPTATANLNENWSVGDFLGLDNDGDNLYDTSDPNCVSLTAGPLTVSPAGGLTSAGTAGGPFTPSSQSYTLANAGTASMNWTASKAQSWVTLSATGGTLAAGASTTVTASINSGANSLAVAGYTDTVTFTNTTNGTGNTTRPVSLTVNAANVAGPLTVSPAGGLTSAGIAGGPFTPSILSYTLTNTGTASMNWTASKAQSWVTLSATGGTLAAGASTTVTASINSGANSLAVAGYTDTVTFTNTTNGTGNATRPVSLTVTAANMAGPLTVSPAEDLTSTGTAGGPFTPSSQSYSLANAGTASINWTASKAQSWVTLSATGGTLAAGASTTVTASINSGANSLAVAGYTDTVTFTNTTNGTGNATRPVSLTVTAAPPPSGTGSIDLSNDSGSFGCSVAGRTESGGSDIDGALILAGLGLVIWGIRMRRRRG